MYTPIGSSMTYMPHFGVMLHFDLTAFEELVMSSVKGVRHELDSFNAEAKPTRNKNNFVHAIGIGMEIIQNAIYLHVITNHDVKLCKEARSAIKSLVLEVNTLVYELGKNDSDFCTDYATQRATTKDDLLKFVEEKW